MFSISNPLSVAFAILGSVYAYSENWPQAAGPHFDWKAEGDAATHWSIVEGKNIKWRATLPEGGQSSVTVWDDRLFVTTYRPLTSADEAKTSTDIVGYCLNAESGEILWSVELPGSVAVGTVGVFSDATVFAPVADENYVCFFNRSGSIGCYDHEGKRVWMREYTPRTRHTNRQCEPILFQDQLLVVEVQDKAAAKKLQRHQPVPEGIDPRSVWTYLHAYDAHTGDLRWVESAGTVIHDTPTIGQLSNGEWAILHARGGPHQPLEAPYGLSLTRLSPGMEGASLWTAEILDLNPMIVNCWDEENVYAFAGEDHIILDTDTGKVRSRRSLRKGVDLWSRDYKSGTWSLHSDVDLADKKPRLNTYHTNIVVGDWHYFLAHERSAIGRVNLRTEKVEYLEVPIQLAVSAKGARELIWNAVDAIPIVPENARGINLRVDKRSAGTGWGHVSAASPILVGPYLYFPVMSGTVYVVDTRAPEFSEKALVAINDLGPAGTTWSLSSLSYSEGRLYARTLKEVICIEDRQG